MDVQINSSNDINTSSETNFWAEEEIRRGLKRFDSRLTRIEVHLSDREGTKSGSIDTRCLIEARPTGFGPITASHDGDSISAAIAGATKKLTAALDRQFGKMTSRKGH